MRAVRIPDSVWAAAQRAAAARGETLTAVIERALRGYARRHPVPDDDSDE